MNIELLKKLRKLTDEHQMSIVGGHIVRDVIDAILDEPAPAAVPVTSCPVHGAPFVTKIEGERITFECGCELLWNDLKRKPPAAPQELPKCVLCGCDAFKGNDATWCKNSICPLGKQFSNFNFSQWRKLHAPRDSDEAVRLAHFIVDNPMFAKTERSAAAAILARAGKGGAT